MYMYVCMYVCIFDLHVCTYVCMYAHMYVLGLLPHYFRSCCVSCVSGSHVTTHNFMPSAKSHAGCREQKWVVCWCACLTFLTRVCEYTILLSGHILHTDGTILGDLACMRACCMPAYVFTHAYSRNCVRTDAHLGWLEQSENRCARTSVYAFIDEMLFCSTGETLARVLGANYAAISMLLPATGVTWVFRILWCAAALDALPPCCAHLRVRKFESNPRAPAAMTCTGSVFLCRNVHVLQ
jgi:hypothetical protein